MDEKSTKGKRKKYSHEDGKFLPTYIPEFTTPDEYIDARVEILREHLFIGVTDEDVRYLREFKTEGEICAAIKGLINKYWE